VLLDLWLSGLRQNQEPDRDLLPGAEALKKPGRPTFFETPAWSFNMGMKFLLVGWIVELESPL